MYSLILHNLRSGAAERGALLAAVLAPFLAVLAFPHYWEGDIACFQGWAECFKISAAQPFDSCSPVTANYPFLGMVFSAGAIALIQEWVGSEGTEIVAALFRIYLAAVDGLGIVVLFAILQELRVRFAGWWSLLFSALPGVRVGGAMWGQIDGVSQLMLSLSIFAFLKADNALSAGRSRAAACAMTLQLMFMLSALLTKQLAVFTLPALALMYCVLLLRIWRATPAARSLAVLGSALALAGASWIDRLLAVPEGYWGSGLVHAFIGNGGYRLAGKISGNGFNIFVLLGRDQWSSSRVPIEGLSIGPLSISITPHFAGLLLFGAATLLFLVVWLRRSLARSVPRTSQYAADLLILGALTNLSMAVLLTDTHERYLYHYAFLLYPAILARLPHSPLHLLMLAVLLSQTVIYGLFVYSVLDSVPPGLVWIVRQNFMAVFNLCVLVLVAGYFMICCGRGSGVAGFKRTEDQ